MTKTEHLNGLEEKAEMTQILKQNIASNLDPKRDIDNQYILTQQSWRLRESDWSGNSKHSPLSTSQVVNNAFAHNSVAQIIEFTKKIRLKHKGDLYLLPTFV